MSTILHVLENVRADMVNAVCSCGGPDCDGAVYMEASPTWGPAVASWIDDDLASGIDPDVIAEAVAELRTYFYEPWGVR